MPEKHELLISLLSFHNLMVPTACAICMSLQNIAVTIRACVSLHRHAWPTSRSGLFA